MGDVPVQVIACIEVAGEWKAGASQTGLWGSLLPAAWSYMLAARSRELGTAWTTLHLAYEEEAAEILGLPSHVRQGVLIPTAYYTGETFRPPPAVPWTTCCTSTTGEPQPLLRQAARSRTCMARSAISIANLVSGSPNRSPSVRSSWRMR